MVSGPEVTIGFVGNMLLGSTAVAMLTVSNEHIELVLLTHEPRMEEATMTPLGETMLVANTSV